MKINDIFILFFILLHLYLIFLLIKLIFKKKYIKKNIPIEASIPSQFEILENSDLSIIDESQINEKKNPQNVALIAIRSTVHDNKLYEDFIEKHYYKMFPNGDRNAAGFRFFQYIYDNLVKNEELFDSYNKLYCAVSGSLVQPSNNNFDILKVKDLNGNCVIGKYYRCCTPCNCDIMKYTKVIKTKIAIPKNSNNMVEKIFLTIGDPCINENKIPNDISKSVVNCKNYLAQNGYRINDKGEITKKEGRLIIGLLYPIENSKEEKEMLQTSIDRCINGNKRFLTKPDKLEYGMGDIFVKFSLINNDDKFTHTIDDFCK